MTVRCSILDKFRIRVFSPPKGIELLGKDCIESERFCLRTLLLGAWPASQWFKAHVISRAESGTFISTKGKLLMLSSLGFY